jgi:riboflavin biosynthesis pyrimidine reductase
MEQTEGQVLRLLPAPCHTEPLKGLFLRSNLRAAMGGMDKVFVYSNFITSLDGRISLSDPVSGRRRVPPATANPHDLRLYRELIAQADVVVTTSRHLRGMAVRRQPDMVSLGGNESTDLRNWRKEQGLTEQPQLAVLSAQLDLPPLKQLPHQSTPILVLTWTNVSAAKLAAVRALGYEVLHCGAGPDLDGRELCKAMAARGHRYVYSVAGPLALTALLTAGVLDRLYLTWALRLLGGRSFDTLVRGEHLNPPRDFVVEALYLDNGLPQGPRQLFAVLNHQSVAGQGAAPIARE